MFNWGLAPSVNVDVSGILAVGAPYEVRNAQDYFGPPVMSGVYAGGTIALPMSGLSVATPIGGAVMPPPTGPEFNRVRRENGAAAAPGRGVHVQPLRAADQRAGHVHRCVDGKPHGLAVEFRRRRDVDPA